MAPVVVTMVADLEFIKFKVKNLRRRWSAIQTWQNQDTDFGFSDVSMDNVEEKKNKMPGSVESLPSDDAEVMRFDQSRACNCKLLILELDLLQHLHRHDPFPD